MADQNADSRVQAVIATLAYVADLEFAKGNESASAEYRKVIEDISSGSPDDWWSCPLCEETECDDGCALAPIRAEADASHRTEGQ